MNLFQISETIQGKGKRKKKSTMKRGSAGSKTRAGSKRKLNEKVSEVVAESRSASNSEQPLLRNTYPQQTTSGKSRRLQSNQNNSIIEQRVLKTGIPDGIFHNAKEATAKAVTNFKFVRNHDGEQSNQTQQNVQRHLIEQFDEIDEQFNRQATFVNEDLVQVAVDAGDDEQFPDVLEENKDSDSEEDLDGEVEQIVEVPFDQQSKADSEVFVRNTVEDFESLRGVPAFEKFIKKVVAEERKGQRSTAQLPTGNRVKATTPQKGSRKNDGMLSGISTVKSPSDTTIYAPAFNQKLNSPMVEFLNDLASNAQQINQSRPLIVPGKVGDNTSIVGSRADGDITNQIINFIKGIRVETAASPAGVIKEPVPTTSNTREDQIEVARKKANDSIIEAERFKAAVNAPPGTTQINISNRLSDLDIDDQFFHVTCHLDDGLKGKIEQGEFVELDRLLPKVRNGRAGSQNEHKMDLIYKDGHSYFVPAGSDNRITGIRKWEQAFRIYATVYSQANPLRAAEIWQYVHTINTAAGSYTWDNVSQYDVTFRHLMSQYPNRSWAKIYQQMWSLSMRDPIQRNNYQHRNAHGNSFGNNSFSGGHGQGSSQHKPTQNTQNKPKKPNYCWTFNKGHCKAGASCNFVDRCSYCDAADHGLNACQKAKEAGNPAATGASAKK